MTDNITNYDTMATAITMVREGMESGNEKLVDTATEMISVYALASIADSLHELTSALNLPRLIRQTENALGAIESAADHISRRHG